MPTANGVEESSGRIRVLLAEDHPIVRYGLRRLLEREPDLEVCCEAGDVPSVLKGIEEARPDMVILDVSLHGHSGVELMKDIKARRPGLPVLLLSMHDEGMYAERALRAGAKGYIMKDQTPEEVLAAIRKVLRGGIYLSEKMAGRMVQQAVSGIRLQAASPVERLSDREIEVFEFIGRGTSTREIAEALHLSVKTVETHKAHIKEKMGLAHTQELLLHGIQWLHERDGGVHPPACGRV